MKFFTIQLTLSSGEVLEKRTKNLDKLLYDMSLEWPQYKEYRMLEILGLTHMVKGYIISLKQL